MAFHHRMNGPHPLRRETLPPRETRSSFGPILGRGLVALIVLFAAKTMVSAGEVGLAIPLLGLFLLVFLADVFGSDRGA